MLALPSSRHSPTFVLICSRSSVLISPVSPANSARKPCVRELMTSISWSETVWTTSRRFWSSPSGHWTNLVCTVGRSGSAHSASGFEPSTGDERPTSEPIAS